MNISDVMSQEVKCCSAEMALDQVGMMMWEGDCGAIPIVDNTNRPIGMVTDRDIAMCCVLNHKAPWELSASTITGSRQLFTCSADDNLDTALTIMKEQRVRRLPVTDSQGCLTGMLSIDDIVACTEKAKSDTTVPYDVTMSTLKAVSIHH